MKIDVSVITDYQKLTMEKDLCDYRYIMSNWNSDTNESDFCHVYYKFYLTARRFIMSDTDKQKAYFSILKDSHLEMDLLSIIRKMKKDMDISSNEFSLASKLLHTRDDHYPIYDRFVREYLSEQGVDFRWHKRSSRDEGLIEYDWALLQSIYKDYLETEQAKECIKWFDQNFPAFVEISKVKKIDSIIFTIQKARQIPNH